MRKAERLKKRELDNGKHLKVSDSTNAKTLDYPIFCFKHLLDGYGLNECNKDQKAHLVSKLVMMAQKSWQSLMFSDYRSGAGFEVIPKGQIKTPLPVNIITEDVDKVLSMRFNNMNHRIIGHRSDHIFHITHIDVSLTAYDH